MEIINMTMVKQQWQTKNNGPYKFHALLLFCTVYLVVCMKKNQRIWSGNLIQFVPCSAQLFAIDGIQFINNGIWIPWPHGYDTKPYCTLLFPSNTHYGYYFNSHRNLLNLNNDDEMFTCLFVCLCLVPQRERDGTDLNGWMSQWWYAHVRGSSSLNNNSVRSKHYSNGMLYA